MQDKSLFIEQRERLLGDIQKYIDQGHKQDEAACGIACNYTSYALLIKNAHHMIVGALQAYTAYAEVYIEDIWVHPEYRRQGLGKKLLEYLENAFIGKGYNNINLVTSHFQAPGFYKKCGFEIEFTRIHKYNPALSKTFFIKYFKDTPQHQGLLA